MAARLEALERVVAEQGRQAAGGHRRPRAWKGAAAALALAVVLVLVAGSPRPLVAAPVQASGHRGGPSVNQQIAQLQQQLAAETTARQQADTALQQAIVGRATMDLDGDGHADLVTGNLAGGNGHVKVFSGATGQEIRSFFAYPGFAGGIFVAAGDVNNAAGDAAPSRPGWGSIRHLD